MNKLIMVILCISIRCISFAQSIDTSVEVKLQIINQMITPEGKLLKGLALSISVINHSNKDVYIPSFNVIDYHVYDNSSSSWRELDLYAHDSHNGADTIPYWNENEITKRLYDVRDDDITKYYFEYVKSFDWSQKGIYETYLGGKQTRRLWGQHLFLKANQEIDNIHVSPIDRMLTKKTDYKITFNTEPRDTAMFDATKSVFYPPCPSNIMGYQIYMPNKLVCNPVYYSTKTSIMPVLLNNTITP